MKIRRLTILLRNLFLDKHKIIKNISGEGNAVNVNPSCVFGELHIIIWGNNNRLEIADNCILKKNNTIFISGDHNHVKLDAHVTFDQDVSLVCCEGTNLTIGKDCIFAKGVRIRTSDQHAIYDKDNIRTNPAKNIDIGEHVWLGNSVVINKGVKIGPGSVIGIGAIVTHDVPANSIAVGVPARVVEQNIHWIESV